MSHILSLDFETSNTFLNGGVPIEIGAVLLDGRMNEVSSFYERMALEEGEDISEEAYEVHGIAPDDLKDCRSRKEVLYAFQRWLIAEGDVTVDGGWQIQFLGQNISFDLQFFFKHFWTEGPMDIFHYTSLDTMMLTEMINKAMIALDGYDYAPFKKMTEYGVLTPSSSLEAQAAAFGLDYSKAHNALFDARLTVECYKRHIKKWTETVREARE